MRDLVYLACPYSHTDPLVMQYRFEAVTAVAAKLMLDGLSVFSPITHCHHLDIENHSWEDFWKPLDFSFLERCSTIIVLKLDGWEISEGVTDEIEFAKQKGIEIKYMIHDKEEL